MPIASMTSALRRLLVACWLAATDRLVASASGLRVAVSFSTARATSTTVPHSAKTPSGGLNRKMMARLIGNQGASKKANRPLPGEELAHRRQVLQRLAGVAARLPQVLLEGSGVHALVQAHVQPVAHAHQDHAAHVLQRAHEDERAHDHQREHQQGGLVAAGEHAVVHLQHVDRRRQHQQVEDGAEDAGGEEGSAEGVQGLGKFALATRGRWLDMTLSRARKGLATGGPAAERGGAPAAGEPAAG
jgi:hypothetical protein